MKKILVLFLTLTLVEFIAAQTTIRCLFIGNSYTYVNDLPQTIKALALGCGDTLEYESSTPSGCTFGQHLSNSVTTSRIAAGGWDAVVLQEQSQFPAFPIGQVEAQCFPYAKQLCELIREATPSANVVFYMTWGRKNGDAGNCGNYPPLCTYEGMDSLLYERYTMMAERNQAAISPVGRVWHVLREQHPEIELYNADESHPSLAGTYAAAVTFYSVLFKKSATCIENDLTLDSETAEAIRETVETVVCDSLSYWYRFTNIFNVINTISCINFQLYPNPSNGYCWIHLFAPAVGELLVYDVCGKVIHREFFFSDDVMKINLQNCISGIYFVELRTRDGKAARKKLLICN